MTALALFAATFAVVFLLGTQQLLVHGRRYRLAFLNSLAIAAANLVLFKIVPHETEGLDLLGYLTGGAFGIVTAMWLHDWVIRMPAWMQPLQPHGEEPLNRNCGADRP